MGLGFGGGFQSQWRDFNTQVIVWPGAESQQPWDIIWKLIPVKVEGTITPSQLLSEMLGSYPMTGTQPGSPPPMLSDAESEHGDFCTIVIEATVIAARKRYRVEHARVFFVFFVRV